MKERMSKLLTVKSIVTLVLTLIFGYLAIVGRIDAKDYVQIFLIIIGFYFGTQSAKNEDTNKGA